jgi:hypothetical protein
MENGNNYICRQSSSLNFLPPVRYVNFEWAREFLLKYVNKLQKREKFAMEILVTYVFGVLLKSQGKPIFGIGFPIKDEKKEINLLDYTDVVNSIKENSEFDTDLLEGPEDKPTAISLQVVRYILGRQKPEEELLDYLRKRKFKHYPIDTGVHLLVWIESDYPFQYKIIYAALKLESVPFGSIIVMGHTGSEDDKTVACMKVFPELEGPFVIDLKSDNANLK